MKVLPRQADGFARRPPSEINAVLVYGPDAGLVAERVRLLRDSVLKGVDDPFRSVDWGADHLLDDPTRLGDEVAALSLTGGRRVILIRSAGDRHSKAFASVWEGVAGDTFVVVEAGDLGPGSSLRRGFENAERCAALACYEDSPEALEGVIRDSLRQAGIKADARVIEMLAGRLGSDRLATRAELEKLILYKGEGTLSEGDVDAIVGDSGATSIDDVVAAAVGGDQVGLDRALQRCAHEDVASVALIRAVARHLMRLQLVVASVARGTPAQRAIEQLRPPVFFRRRAEMMAQAQVWKLPNLQRAGDLVSESELNCKRTGIPDRAVMERALMRLANAARSQGR
ncbi:MAG: DNA polymerase III subunit delta [Alphaproteobacteria bacterium]|nr:DNA polymerase III subunit delta [Alphaproteobacteria bacterium]